MQIAADLRERIRGGSLKSREKLPSVRAIVRDYGVAMATAQRALGALRAEGYIRPERGVGNVVTSQEERGRAASDWVQNSRRTGRVYQAGERAEIVEAAVESASEQVAGALGISAGSEAIRRRRITYRDQHPVSASTSYFPADWAHAAPKLLQRDRIREGAFAYVAAALDRRLGGWQDQYDPAIVSTADAKRLKLDKGTPVTHGRNWVYDDAGEILEYGESVSASRITYRGTMLD
ncbi:MAG: GntR family transcriptional regulator [Nocardioidaceae bacterium]